MAAPNFGELLRKPADEIKKPMPWPAGTYEAFVTNKEYGESRQKKTPFVRFAVKPVRIGEDIDPSEAEGLDFEKKIFQATYYLSEDAQYRVLELAQSCGIETAGRSLGEIIDEIASNQQVLMSVTQRPSENGETIYNDVDSLKGIGA